MKKTVIRMLSLLLCLTCVFSTCGVAAAATKPLDLTPIRGSSLYDISVNKDDDVAFITSTLTTADRSFNHKYENDYLYSSTEFDIIVINYFEDNAYPVFRLWIYYTADDYNYNTGVTFTLGGKDYTFSGISGSDSLTKKDNGVCEDLLIKIGTDNADFLLALLEYGKPFEAEGFDNYKDIAIPMTLHGVEDINVTLDAGFLLDFYALINAFSNINGIDYLSKANATSMKVH